MEKALSDAVKRAADVCVAAFGLACSIPIWAVLATAIVLEDGWPVLYLQRRVGIGGRVFWVYKFRSMRKDAEKYSGAVFAEENDPRITRIGRIMRKAALDEIPQLLNIFNGDMSWVGPRPERPEFVREFLRDIPGYYQRYQVRPGLTGVAQVYGRYYTKAADKLAYDVYYVRNRSLWLDFRLFVRSWLITFKGRWDSAAAKR
jgi:lipopolysaccharide/colanic/teichoic acid biosynthesis glycosyltransferase